MIRTWLSEWAGTYLEEQYNLHTPPSSLIPCSCGSSNPTQFTCSDCLNLSPRCQDCIVQLHRWMPTHHVQEWRRDHWAKTALSTLGHVLHLGSHDGPCPLAATTKQLTIGNTNSLHVVTARFCACPMAVEPARQLLRAHIFPCSEVLPSSGFTFSLLRQFHLASTEAKTSTKAFYMVMERQTDNALPLTGSDRYRELLCCTRAWMFLSDQKRAGFAASEVSVTSDVSLCCPACPCLNVNYTLADIGEDKQYVATLILMVQLYQHPLGFFIAFKSHTTEASSSFGKINPATSTTSV